MDEYIYKDEAFAIIENKQREICPMGRYSRAAVYGSDREAFDNWQEILDEIEAIPSADVAPVVHGRWEFKDDDGAYPWTTKAICSECKKVIAWNARLSLKNNQIEFAHENHYCLNCGAKMDGELNE